MIREYRMYGLVPYNISPIQQGIQFGHAVVEYSLEFGKTAAYKKWAKKDKTFIILNGGTTNTNNPGSLNIHEMQLYENFIDHACFYEPDLGDQLTAVVFLVDDRVFNKELWPDFKLTSDEELYWNNNKREFKDYNQFLENLDSYHVWKSKLSTDKKEVKKILWLRNYIKPLRLA